VNFAAMIERATEGLGGVYSTDGGVNRPDGYGQAKCPICGRGELMIGLRGGDTITFDCLHECDAEEVLIAVLGLIGKSVFDIDPPRERSRGEVDEAIRVACDALPGGLYEKFGYGTAQCPNCRKHMLVIAATPGLTIGCANCSDQKAAFDATVALLDEAGVLDEVMGA
jgi:hypothetical protein